MKSAVEVNGVTLTRAQIEDALARLNAPEVQTAFHMSVKTSDPNIELGLNAPVGTLFLDRAMVQDVLKNSPKDVPFIAVEPGGAIRGNYGNTQCLDAQARYAPANVVAR